MAEVDLERLVLPALLALLVLGAFVILATSGGGEEPARSGAPAAESSPPRESAAPQQGSVKVRPGDTPTSIAQSAGITVDRLLELNPSLDPRSLRPGRTLKLAP